MTTAERKKEIVVTRDGRTLSTVDVLTGRAFLTGKSGSGKSNTCSVIAEELLERGFNFCIVDTDGEYFSLKERYKLLHVGGDDFADQSVGPDDAEEIARTSIAENVPVLLDVSGYDDAAIAEELVERVVAELFQIEKRERKPYLLIVEEMQEYLPQQGGGDDLARLLERVAKRGRKRGLGICGISQRPSSVDKDFITQCDWMVWHKLTWQNDVDVVRRVLGSDRADAIQEFDPGEAYLMTDWNDRVQRVQFRKKRTHDAGATPGLDQYDELTSHAGTEPDAGSGDADRESPAGNEATADGAGDSSADGEVTSSTAEADPEEDGTDGVHANGATTSGIDDRVRALDDRSHVGRADGYPPADPDRVDRSTDEPTPAPPKKPTAPTPPENRTGLSGNILELGELTIYLARWLGYRVRSLWFGVKNA